MPRGGRSRGGGGSGGVSYPFGPPPKSSYSSAGFTPGRSQLPSKPAAAPQPQPQHPGLFKQAAATAGGVAAGSLIAGAIMGPRERVIVVDNSQNQQQPPADPCAKEVTELLSCIQMIQQTNEPIGACEGFRIKLGKCREKFGDPYGKGQG